MQTDLFLSGGTTTTSTPWKSDNSNPGSGYVTLTNSTGQLRYGDTATPLGAGATFTGTQHGAPALANFYVVDAYADQAGTLFVERSNDLVTWYPVNTSAGTAVAAGTSVSIKTPVTAGSYRVRFTNGATPQGSFAITSAFTGA